LMCMAYWCGVCSGQAPSSSAVVQFEVVDQFGKVLPYKVHIFQINAQAGNLANEFKLLRHESIPYGRYAYALVRSDYSGLVGRVNGTLQVEARFHAVRLAADGGQTSEGIHDGTGPAFRLTGQITPVPSQGDGSLFRVLLQPVFLRTRAALETTIDGRGTFVFSGTLSGVYTMTVIRGDQILDSRLVRIPLNADRVATVMRIDIRLPESPPRVESVRQE